METAIIRQELANDLAIKWDRMRDSVAQAGADAILLADSINIYYATGRVFNGYFFLPVGGDPFFFIKRPNGFAGNNVHYIRKSEQIAEILAQAGIEAPSKVLLEADEISHNEYERLRGALGVETANATGLMRTLRSVKTPWEIEQFRISARKHAETYYRIPELFRPGMTDVELQIEIERVMRYNGSLGLFRVFGPNMDIHMGSLLAGDNAATPSPFDFALGGGGQDEFSPIGANGTVLEQGTAIMVDMAGNYTPYATDMTRVFSVGDLPDEAYSAHQVSISMHERMLSTAGPGTACADIYNMCLEMAAEAGLQECFMGVGQQAKFVGHGIGLQINELPVLTPRSRELLQPGMVFALEPKFIIKGVGAVGIENSYLVTPEGLENLTVFPEQIIKLG